MPGVNNTSLVGNYRVRIKVVLVMVNVTFVVPFGTTVSVTTTDICANHDICDKGPVVTLRGRTNV